MRRLFTFLLILFCFFCGVTSISACTCAEFDAPQAFDKSDGVFVGKVSETGGWFYPFVVFNVEKSWKSVDSNEITVNLNNGMCGDMSFQEGSRYLVYSYEDEGDFYTSVCTRTNLVSSADQDLKFLEDKETLPLKKEYFTRSMRIGAITSLMVLIFLAVGFGLMKIKKPL